MPYLIKFKNLILDILFPALCLHCQKQLSGRDKNNGICNDCLSKIAIHATLFCPVCRNRLPENKKICHRDCKYLLASATNYDDIIKSIIHAFKYKKWSHLQYPLKDIVNTYLDNLKFQNTDFTYYLIIPIPLHKNRQQERGFNQAELIAKIISEKLNLNLEINNLIRFKETKSQVEIKDWEQRRNNLNNSFKILNPAKIAGKNIIIVDDVYTSGSTINEAVKVLKESQVNKIIAFVIAKAR